MRPCRGKEHRLPDIAVGKGLHADATAIIGYRSSRAGPAGLVLGADAVIRSGTVIYLGSRIGARFQAGHNVVIREDTVIGDECSIGDNTIIDSGCRIGDRVRIGANSYVAQFTTIADDVTILDIYQNAASARIYASGWVDYLHLAKWNGRWVIVNVLWELHPKS